MVLLSSFIIPWYKKYFSGIECNILRFPFFTYSSPQQSCLHFCINWVQFLDVPSLYIFNYLYIICGCYFNILSLGSSLSIEICFEFSNIFKYQQPFYFQCASNSDRLQFLRIVLLSAQTLILKTRFRFYFYLCQHLCHQEREENCHLYLLFFFIVTRLTK